MGLSLHVSDFLTEVGGRLKFEDEVACVMMKPGVNRDGWWTSEELVKQVVLFINYHYRLFIDKDLFIS
jgi:hypothetical protein